MMETDIEKVVEYAKERWNSIEKSFCVHDIVGILDKKVSNASAILTMLVRSGVLKQLPYKSKCKSCKIDHFFYQLNPSRATEGRKQRKTKRNSVPSKGKKTTIQFDFEDFRVTIIKEGI